MGNAEDCQKVHEPSKETFVEKEQSPEVRTGVR